VTPLPERSCTRTVAGRIGTAIDLVPPAILERIGPCPFFEGDAVFAGLSADYGEFEYERDGRRHVMRHRDSASCFYRRERSGRYSSAVHIPWAGRGYVGEYLVGVVLHELGHALWNALIKPHVRWRVFWSPGDREVRHIHSSGLVPSMLPFTSYQPRDIGEQFAEAFAMWLAPGSILEATGVDVSAFYRAQTRWAVDDWGVRTDNRRLLAWLNDLAGWDGDVPPQSLRS
jgi:hypothetical protein